MSEIPREGSNGISMALAVSLDRSAGVVVEYGYRQCSSAVADNRICNGEEEDEYAGRRATENRAS